MEEMFTGIIWVTKKREEIDLANIPDEHLINIALYLERCYPWRKRMTSYIQDELELRGLLVDYLLRR